MEANVRRRRSIRKMLRKNMCSNQSLTLIIETFFYWFFGWMFHVWISKTYKKFMCEMNHIILMLASPSQIIFFRWSFFSSQTVASSNFSFSFTFLPSCINFRKKHNHLQRFALIGLLVKSQGYFCQQTL